MGNIRLNSRNKIVNKIDPIYIFLDRVLFASLFRPPKANMPNEFEIIEEEQIDFLVDNMKKHRLILWVNILLVLFLSFYGLDVILNNGNTSIVVTGLLAPAMITGAAWYAISFGGIPEKFISIAFLLTFSMFLSFTLSMTLLTSLLCAITPWFVGLFILVPIYLSLYIASMLYDNLDGLKIGLDSTMLKFSRASINYYRKHGYLTEAETEKEAFTDSNTSSGQIEFFTYLVNTLNNNLKQLKQKNSLGIANQLIASSIDILYQILNVGLDDKSIDRDVGYNNFIINAYNMDQKDVDEMTFKSLINIVAHLDLQLENVAGNELENIKEKLSSHYNNFKVTENNEEMQELGDLVFSQTFAQLLELVSAYRHSLFGTE